MLEAEVVAHTIILLALQVGQVLVVMADHQSVILDKLAQQAQ
jgi:hypothetical protein